MFLRISKLHATHANIDKTVNKKNFQNDTGNWGLHELIHRWICIKEVKFPSPAAGLKRAKIVNDIEDSSSLFRRIKQKNKTFND